MLVPRRVRRRLLLPPGWVALGFLLLLGCQALQPWAGRVKLWNVMQLTMPKLKLTKEDVRIYGRAYQLPYKSPAELNSVRPWHDVKFKGEALSDFLSAATTESAIRRIIADTSHAGGVRIRFLPGATYANLIRVLDIMNYNDHKKYWLDIRHQPITLYATTDKKSSYKSVPIFSCGTGYYENLNFQAKNNLQKVVASSWLKFLTMWQQPWMELACFLALFSVLNLRRLISF